jgi:hypothetical protein
MPGRASGVAVRAREKRAHDRHIVPINPQSIDLTPFPGPNRVLKKSELSLPNRLGSPQLHCLPYWGAKSFFNTLLSTFREAISSVHTHSESRSARDRHSPITGRFRSSDSAENRVEDPPSDHQYCFARSVAIVRRIVSSTCSWPIERKNAT